MNRHLRRKRLNTHSGFLEYLTVRLSGFTPKVN